jgi:hypothetical protein
VSGVGAKLLAKMGWKEGSGLGRLGEGNTEPIKFTEVKTDRKGLDSSIRVNDHEKDVVRKAETQEEEDQMTWDTIKASKEVDRSDPKAVFSELKSKSFWSWHDTGMKGPENVHLRLRQQKKAARDRVPLELEGKHPVSAVAELCQRRGWQQPTFSTEQPASGGGFLFKVEVNGIVYLPAAASDTKKLAKLAAAQHCLEKMGLVPKTEAAS